MCCFMDFVKVRGPLRLQGDEGAVSCREMWSVALWKGILLSFEGKFSILMCDLFLFCFVVLSA